MFISKKEKEAILHEISHLHWQITNLSKRIFQLEGKASVKTPAKRGRPVGSKNKGKVA